MPAGAPAIDVLKSPSHPADHALVPLAGPLTLPADNDWAIRIATALEPRRMIFAWPGEKAAGVRCFLAKQEVAATSDDIAAAEQACTPGHTPSMERIDRVLTPAALAALIDEENAVTIDAVVNSLVSTTGIIPFVGAGMSQPFKAPMWGDFLRLAAVTDEEKRKVDEHIKDGKYEDAAQLLDAGENGDRFRKLVTELLDPEVKESQRRTGPLAILPLLTAGPVITTNFDRVLEAFYDAAGKPFTGPSWIAGRKAVPILNAIQQNAHCLIKLHGDVREKDTFTFTALEYEQSYGNAQSGKRGVLTDLGNVVYTNRPLLFLGCSLEKDRTLAVLEQVAAQNPYLKHYAVLAAMELVSAMDARREVLKRCGIVPLWFAPGDFRQIGVLLERLLERSSVEDVMLAAGDDLPLAQAAPPPFQTVAQSVPPPPEPSPDLTDEHIGKVAACVARGQVIVFLGAGVHPASLLGDAFYEELATRANATVTARYRSDVAEQFANKFGRPALSDAIEQVMASHVFAPGLVHKLIAGLAQRPAIEGVDRPVIVFTTNYDDALETTLTSASVPYHLFLYQPDGDYARRFLHRSPSGNLRAIRNPDGVYKLEPEAAIVVKMNGGLDPRRELPGRFAVTSRDFVEVACRIPRVLPSVVRSQLKNRSLLFVAHGLFEPDVRELARYAHAQRGSRPSWAIQRGKRTDEIEYWRDSCGVELIDADRDTYILKLSETLRTQFGVAT